MKINVFLGACLAGLILMAGGGVKAQSVNQSGLLAAIQAIQQQIAMLEQLLAQMPQQTGSVNDSGITYTSTMWQMYPSQADVASCVSADGNTYPAIGFKSANWFLWNKCASQKIYPVNAGKMVALSVYGDSTPDSICKYPSFTLYDNIDGNWQKAATVDLSGYQDSATHNYFYMPISDQIKIEALNCFYMKVYTGNLSAMQRQLTNNTNLDFGSNYGLPASATAPVPASNTWVKLLSPAGGEMWRSGNSYTIMWSSANVDNVWLSIKNDTPSANGSGTLKDISPSFTAIPAAVGYYTWMVNDSWLPAGDRNKFKISISEGGPGSGGVSDESGYFTILAH
jgi:hypothetical protein